MTNLALITGASSGIGAEFARIHAQKGGDVILVARREKKLVDLKTELESKFSIRAHVFVSDLSEPNAAVKLYEDVKAANLDVEFLINNAGIGGQGAHLQRDPATESAMIRLNIEAVMTLCHAFAQDMIRRGSGRILNIGSIAGMMPGPYQAVYFATKAFVNSYSQSLASELEGTGVTATVLTPGLVHTEFVQTAGLDKTGVRRQRGASAKSVARLGYRSMMRGKLLVGNDKIMSFVLRFMQPFVSRRFMARAVKRVQIEQ